jgi:hypothetical protein
MKARELSRNNRSLVEYMRNDFIQQTNFGGAFS